MVNKCSAPKCKTGYSSKSQEPLDKKLSTFHFPLGKDKEELNKKWIRFTNRADWTPTKNSVLCELHFDDRYLIHGKRTTLNWNLDPIPTKHSKELENLHSVLPTTTTTRKPPSKRNFQDDQLMEFKSKDIINSLKDFNESNTPPGFTLQKFDNTVVLYRLKFDEVKNVRNNLLNGKKFVFPEFSYHKFSRPLVCTSGYISWADLDRIYDKDKELKENLRKASKLFIPSSPSRKQ